MLQSVSSVFIVYRRKTLTGSPDPTHANGTNKPCIIFGASAFIAGGVTFILSETKGQTLKQTVEEVETFMKENMCQVYNW